MTLSAGILLFEGVEELDAVGPYEVFAVAAEMEPSFVRVFTIAEKSGVVNCHKKLRVYADYSFQETPALDMLIVPGGIGAHQAAKDPVILDWVRQEANKVQWLVSVCTGTRILGAAGLLQGKKVTTHWDEISELRHTNYAGEVMEDVRYVKDGRLITSAGISAGIDMALWLVGYLSGRPDLARKVQKELDYFPAPPYMAELDN